MAEPVEVQALERISTEVNESQIKVVLSTHCIKAQAVLADRLRKQCERNKETCNFISSANLKLQAEITQADQEIKSFLFAQDTIKMANVELKKEWLLAKDKKLDIIERVKTGEKKYEELWLECKARYESLPFIQKLLQAKDKARNLEAIIAKLEADEKTLHEEFVAKAEACRKSDRKRVVQLAEFIVHEMPESINKIKEKSLAINNLMNELNNLLIQSKNNADTKYSTQSTVVRQDDPDRDWPVVKHMNDSTLIMPKLQLGNFDLDVYSIKLNQVKRADSLCATPEKNNDVMTLYLGNDVSKINRNAKPTDEYTSSYFSKPSVAYEEVKTQNYSKRKLINILEDIKIDKNDALSLMTKVNTETLQLVDSISAGNKNTDAKSEGKKPIESEEIEEIDMTSSNADILLPPSPFVDITLVYQESQEPLKEKVASTYEEEMILPHPKSTQEGSGRKRVSFDLPAALESSKNIASGDEKPNKDKNDVTETDNSQLDVSTVVDEGFAKLKDMLMKKQNLDLSPQFVYAKNTMVPLSLQKDDDKVVKSKFFENKRSTESETDIPPSLYNAEENEVNEIAEKPIEHDAQSTNQTVEANKIVEMDVEDGSSPKKHKPNETMKLDKPISGLLFSHDEAQSIPDSLDISVSTMGYEDTDFPHCIDSSILLSPKADLPMTSGEYPEVLSQEVPNFLSGLRKTGLSFFGHLNSSDAKAESSATGNQGSGGFSFNFGGEEKKSRGGLFSMFQ